MKIYGPYRRKDGRSHIVIKDKARVTTKSYPKFLMENKLKRKLRQHEHVDHINDDPEDDRIENFQILTPSANNKKARKFHNSEAKILIFICPVCDKPFERFARDFKHNQLQRGCSGPYCSKRCAGQAGK